MIIPIAELLLLQETQSLAVSYVVLVLFDGSV